jgi:hypothetical protein
MNAHQDIIEQISKEIWYEDPGIGLEDLRLKLVQHLNSMNLDEEVVLTKRQVKLAKASIPYTCITNGKYDDSQKIGASFNHSQKIMGQERMNFIQMKIEERRRLRVERHFEEADYIYRGLEKMGVIINDHTKTWSYDVIHHISNENSKCKQNPEDENFNLNPNNNNEQSTTKVECQRCNQWFDSRNTLFKHLRDPSSPCGNAIFASGEKISAPPSTIVKDEKRRIHQHKIVTKRLGSRFSSNNRIMIKNSKGSVVIKNTSDFSLISASSCVFMGNLPSKWMSFVNIQSLLRAYLPKDVYPPWIYKLIYPEQFITEIVDQHPHQHHLGYAIIVFRDSLEVEQVLSAMNAIKINPNISFVDSTSISVTDGDQSSQNYILLEMRRIQKDDVLPLLQQSPSAPESISKLKIKWDTENEEIDSKCESDETSTIAGEECSKISKHLDPPLYHQFRSLSTDELRRRSILLQNKYKIEVDNKLSNNKDHSYVQTSPSSSSHEYHPHGTNVQSKKLPNHASLLMEQHESSLQMLVSLHERHCCTTRREVRHEGQPLPSTFVHKVTTLLTKLRWPGRNERKNLTSEHYLVLQTNANVVDRFYGELSQSCEALMQWIDPEYYYSGIAVTKNFISSPHIDDLDQSYQYAISLGEFENGGELCVEGYDEEEEEYVVHVVNTRNRVVRVDGRNVHWVRPWLSGDRFSLVFYDTSNRNPKAVIRSGVDLEFLSCEGK